MKKLFKKADGGLTAIVIIVIILVFIGWLVKLGDRECTKDSECGKESYCGSDFSCHRIPVIEKTNNVIQYDLKWPALIIGIAIVLAAYVIKGGRIPLRKEGSHGSAHSGENSPLSHSYYHTHDSHSDHKEEHH